VFSLALETPDPADHDPVAQLVARLLWSGDTTALRGAELFARPGWIGLRAHPAPLATASYGTPALPAWIPDWLRETLAPATRPFLAKYQPSPPCVPVCHRPQPAEPSVVVQPAGLRGRSVVRHPAGLSSPAPSASLQHPPYPRSPAWRHPSASRHSLPRPATGPHHPVTVGYRVDFFENIVGIFPAETEVASMTGVPEPDRREGRTG